MDHSMDGMPLAGDLQDAKEEQASTEAESTEPQFASNSHYLGHIEVDSAYDTDADSTFSEGFSTTTSLNSSVTNYMYENGRRYHGYKGGRYMMPNDEMEMDREDMKHHISLLMLEGRLHLAPIPKKPQRILDVGTGTGIWAMQIADIYPSAEVIATDLSPIQPTWVSPNLKFEIDDAEAEWLYDQDSLDLVHVRYMAHAIRNWPRLFGQALKAIKPGGFVEVVDWHFIPASYDNSLPENSQIQAFYDVIQSAAIKVGLDMAIAQKLRGMVEDAGFVNIKEEIFDLPMGPWPKDPRLKEIGMFQQIQVTEGLSGIAMGLLTRVLGWTTQQVEVWLVGVRKEMRDRSVHSFWKMHVITGQKAPERYRSPRRSEEPELEFPMSEAPAQPQVSSMTESKDEAMLDAAAPVASQDIQSVPPPPPPTAEPTSAAVFQPGPTHQQQEVPPAAPKPIEVLPAVQAMDTQPTQKSPVTTSVMETTMPIPTNQATQSPANEVNISTSLPKQQDTLTSNLLNPQQRPSGSHDQQARPHSSIY